MRVRFFLYIFVIISNMIMVPVSTIIALAVAAVLGFAVPIALARYVVKKQNVAKKTVLIGAAVFVVFALGLESIAHSVILKGPQGASIMSTVWNYALYGGFIAALFEESGRFIAMKWLLRDQPSDLKSALGYGIGHGGVEMLLLFGITMISNLAISFFINSGHAETLFGNVPAESQAQIQAQFAALQESNFVGGVALGLWERFSALILQVCLSLLMWTAVRRGGRWMWLALLPFLFHFLVDALAVVLSRSTSMVMVEVIIFAMVLAIAAITWLLTRPQRAGEADLPV